jgi:hypothetical protein
MALDGVALIEIDGPEALTLIPGFSCEPASWK